MMKIISKSFIFSIIILMGLGSVFLFIIPFSKAMAQDLFLINSTWPSDFSRDSKQEIQESLANISVKLKRIIPLEIKNKIKDRSLGLKIIPDLGRAGLFIQGPYKIKIENNILEESQNGLYILLDSDVFKSRDFERTFVHEYFHAIHAVINPQEESWVKEGMAQIFEYFFEGHLNLANIQWAFLRSSTSLVDTYHLQDLAHSQYGINGLYFYYLYQQCGKEKFFWDLLNRSQLHGITNINFILKELNSPKKQCSNFKQSAIYFYLALATNSKDYTDRNNPDKLFIYPTTMKATFSYWDKKSDFQKIGQVKNLSPIEIAPTLHSQALTYCQKKCQIFYLPKIFPFEIKLTPPTSTNELEDYRIFIIKMND